MFKILLLTALCFTNFAIASTAETEASIKSKKNSLIKKSQTVFSSLDSNETKRPKADTSGEAETQETLETSNEENILANNEADSTSNEEIEKNNEDSPSGLLMTNDPEVDAKFLCNVKSEDGIGEVVDSEDKIETEENKNFANSWKLVMGQRCYILRPLAANSLLSYLPMNKTVTLKSLFENLSCNFPTTSPQNTLRLRLDNNFGYLNSLSINISTKTILAAPVASGVVCSTPTLFKNGFEAL